MKINEIIKKKRITLGMTQEQVADYLGVSTPAVNKWEKGGCYPDITLLPALARLLKVDLNRLQGRLYIKKGEFDKASELFSYKLIEATTDIFTILISMMEIALKDGRKEDAKYFAEILEKTTDLYDLWDYNGQVGYFKLYSDEKDADNFVIVLKKMLEAMKKPWNPSKSKLYANMKVNQSEEGFEQFIDTFVNTLKSDVEGELGFVKNNEEFNELINNI
ncbi:helix-turn-helix transcriptional regulator [Clostridium sp. 29_15]|uniref:helix-turn-helix transcriptional regulator n=1 Tax=Clostridium sp. 29_15 TaxID=1896982 RepID=UPI00095D33C4|nr:helix-turn-helix transcriptional regulator [Clostridium sp. 29_15]OKZ86839.1 MAG: hypothetical protein BHW04_06410 [Clostridium sp. 29_15]